MSIRQSLATSLQAYRVDRGLSIEAFAELLCISRSTLQSYLKGTANPTIGTLELMAAKMNTTTAALLHEDHQAVIHLAGLVREVTVLPREKKLQFMKSLQQMVGLWDG